MRGLMVSTLLAAALAACSHAQTVRLQSSTVEVGPGLRPIAGIQANAITWYLLFVAIPGQVNLDRVVNRMLIARAKEMGADKVVNLSFDSTPDGGIWSLRKLFLWRSARASGIAVQVTAPAADPEADQGPEGPAPAAPPAAPPAQPAPGP